MCIPLKLTHPIFADDQMIFYKDNVSSVNRVIEVVGYFSKVTGLMASMDKSIIFLAGVDNCIKEQLLARTSFALGTLPIRYLDLPLSPKKGNKLDYHLLVEKITQED